MGQMVRDCDCEADTDFFINFIVDIPTIYGPCSLVDGQDVSDHYGTADADNIATGHHVAASDIATGDNVSSHHRSTYHHDHHGPKWWRHLLLT